LRIYRHCSLAGAQSPRSGDAGSFETGGWIE
jgi:hypothetical protein